MSAPLPIKTDPELLRLLAKARDHVMTPEEIQAQRESWARGMAPCEHGVADWEECADCRAGTHREERKP